MNRSLTNSSMHLVAVEAAGAKEKKGAEKKAQRKKCCSRHEGKKGCREEAGDEEVGGLDEREIRCVHRFSIIC